MEVILDTESAERLLSEPLAIIFKHSRTCGVSVSALDEVLRFVSLRPEQKIHQVDVHNSKKASDYIQEKTGVRHESPQLIILRYGKVIWSASHRAITTKALSVAIE